MNNHALFPVDMLDHLSYYLIPSTGPIFIPNKHSKMTYAQQNRKAKKEKEKKKPLTEGLIKESKQKQLRASITKI